MFFCLVFYAAIIAGKRMMSPYFEGITVKLMAGWLDAGIFWLISMEEKKSWILFDI